MPTYAPGVKAGDSITYGEFSFNGSTPYPPFPANLTRIKITVQNVNTQTNQVDASQVYNYKNGTQSTQNLSGNTVTGQGNVFPYLTAGNLTAGDLLFNTQYGPQFVINETVNRVYAGALRSTNLFNITFNSYGQSVRASFYWDAQTGFLLEASEYVNYTYPSQAFSLYLEATETNVWTSDSSPDYSLDASALSSQIIHGGESTSFRLDLASLNGFTDTVSLSLSIQASNPSNDTQLPNTILNPTNVTLSPNVRASAGVAVSSNSTTTVGQYLINVDGASSINHKARLLLVVAPPDFRIDANPGNLTIFQGTTKNSAITVTGRGGFTGTVFLQVQTSSPFGPFVTASLSQSTLTLNSTITSATSILTVSAQNSQPGLTSVYITAQSSNLYQNLYIPVNVTGPDFRIAASPLSLTLKQGETAQTLITLTSILGFSGPISLSTSTYGGISSTLASTFLQLPADGQVNTTLTVTALVTSPPGFSSVYVTGTSLGGISHSVYVAVNVTGPDFRFTSSNYFFTLEQGQTANSTLTLSSVQGFTGTISLSISAYGPVSATVNPSNVDLNANQTVATSTLTLTVLPTSPSTYAQVDVRATSGNIAHDIFVQINVVGPDFSIATNPSFLSIPQGGSGQAAITLSSIGNFSGSVFLSTQTSLGTAFTTDPVNVTAGGAVSTTLTFSVPLNTAPGYYYVGITATAGSLTRYSQVTVYVTGPDFTLTAIPSYLTIQQGGSASSTLFITSLDDLSGTVNLSVAVSGPFILSPLNTTLTLSANSTLTTALKFSTSPGATPGAYSALITASVGSITHYAYINIQVTGPDFQIVTSPGQLFLKPGETGSATVYLSSINGFSGNVSLAISSNGVTVTPTNATLFLAPGGQNSTTITILAPATQGFSTVYFVYIQASSGNLSHFTQIFVQVIAPDFSIIANPYQLSIQAGSSAQSTLQLTSLNGFNGTVQLSAFPIIAGNFTIGGGNSTGWIGVVLSSSNVTLTPGGSASVVLNITTTPSAAGRNFIVQVEATSGNLTRFASVYITVTGPSFQLSVNPSFVSLAQGGTASANVVASSVNGFLGNVTLAAFSPFFTSLTPENITLTPGGSAVSMLNVTATSTIAPGFYTVVITGTSGTMIQTTFLQVEVIGPAFTLSSNPSFLTLNPGSSGNSTITLTKPIRFNGTIALFERSFPGGLVTNLSPRTLVLNSNTTSATSLLTVTVPTNTPSGTYIIVIGAEANGSVVNTTVFVQVTASDFTLFTFPSSITVSQGGSASTTLLVSGIGSFSGLVNFTAFAFGPGPGLQESFSPLNVTLSPSIQNATLTLTVSAAPETIPGSYNVTIVGVGYTNGTGIAHPALVQVTVTARPDFTIAASPIFVDIIQGGTATFAFTLDSNNGFNGLVTLSAELTPPGPTVSFPNNTIFLAQGSFVTSTLTVGAGDSPVGYYNVTISAVSGSLSHQVVVNIHIAPKPDFSLSTSPAGLIIVSGASTTSTITISPINGFSGPVNLSTAGPAELSTSFSVNPIVNGTTSTLTIAASSSIAPGFYTVTVTAASGSITHSSTLNVTIASSTKTNLVVSQVSWNHRLSLSKNGNTQTFTLTVKNTGKNPLYIQLLATGNSTDLKTSFTVQSVVIPLSPGSSPTISLSQPFDSTSIGSRFNFTLQLYYGTSVDKSGNILNPQTLQVVKGSFTIVR